MTKKEFIEALDKVNTLLPEQQKFTLDLYKIYFDFLSTYTKEELKEASMYLIENTNLYYRPSVKAFIETADSIRLNGRDKRFNHIFEAIRLDILIYGRRRPNYKDEIVETIEDIGGWDSLTILDSDSFNDLKKDFINILKEKFSTKKILNKDVRGLLENDNKN